MINFLDDIYETLKNSENGLSSKEVTERNELPRGSGFCQRRSRVNFKHVHIQFR